MAVQTLEGREVLTTQLKNQFTELVTSVAIAGQNNLTSTHVVSEATVMHLLNQVYGWSLENANAIRQNYPGVDLIDEGRRIAVQVTANRTIDKVRHTLEEVGKSGVMYDRLIFLFLTHGAPTRGMQDCTVPAYSGGKELWTLSDVMGDAINLPIEKLQALTELMAAELGRVREVVKDLPHLDLPPVSALPPTGFVGRETELEDIRTQFSNGDKQVVLTGLGGMGKTELAVRYGREHPGMVYFIRFDGSFNRTIANMARAIRPRLADEELKLEEAILRKRVLNLLAKSGPDDLLIIDNADSPTGVLADLLKDGYEDIRKLPLKLLLTTRSDAPRATKITPMPEEPLFQIFKNHGAELTRNEMADLIRAVNGHTLTVDLIARTLADNWTPVSTQEMLDAIEKSTMAQEDFPEVGTDYNQDPEQMHIYQRLRGVFQVAKVPDTEQKVLKCAVLLPEAGMDVRLFRNALDDETRRVFPKVGKQGWLNADHKVLTIHPVIRLVCQTELNPTDADCEDFLERLWAQYDRKDYRPAHYTQMAELFAEAHDRIGSHHGRWLNYSGILWNELTEYQKLLDMYHPRIKSLERNLPEDSEELARAYNYYGISLEKMGHYDSALSYGEKALSIRQSVLRPNDAELAYSYNNVGEAYGDLGNLKKALDFKLKALKIFQEMLSGDDPDLAISYDNVGITYYESGKFPEAIEYQSKALGIREKALSIEHPVLAYSYGNLGNCYCAMGEYKTALDFQLKALKIRESTLPPEHHDLAFSYNGLGGIYGGLGEHQKALEFQLKALEILEKALPPEHPNLATACNNVAWTYHDLRNLQSAAAYMRRAADIISRSSLPKTHPDRINYPKWADQFEKEAKMEQAIRATMQGFGPASFPFGKK